MSEDRPVGEPLAPNAQSYRLIIDSIPALIVTTTSTGELEFVNRQVLDYTGKTLGELRSWKIGDAAHPQDVSRVKAAWKASVETGEPYDIEYRIRRADGVYRWFHVRAVPQREAQGRIIRWHAVFTDVDVLKRAVTERGLAEEALHESERKSRLVVDSIPGLVALLTADGDLQFVNRQILEYTGRTLEELKRWGTSDTVHPEDLPHIIEVFKQSIATGSPYEIMERLRRSDGVYRWFQNNGFPLRDTGGEIVGWCVLLTDVDDRKRAEDALHKSEERWRAVFENSAIGVALTDLHGRFLATNSAFQKMLGYTEDEISGLTFLEVTHEDFRESNWQLVTELLEGRRTQFQIEKQYWRKDGSLIWVSNNVSLVPGTKSMPRFLMALSEDITERKRAEETLRRTQAELTHVTRVASLGEMTASIAHEVNQPLAAVVNSASACLNWLDAGKPQEARRSASRAIAESHRASEIIGRIRALAKKSPPQKERLDVNEMIREVVALARSEIQRHGVALETQLSERVPVVRADRIQLQQVILNLMINAIEAMSGAGQAPRELLIRSSTDESCNVVIWVQDSGPGFDPKNLVQLFEAFYTTKPQGLGMGLAISRSIIDAHGGRLWATANAPRGAVFQFTLPTGGGTQ